VALVIDPSGPSGSVILSGELRSIKDGGSRRILPEYVAEYVARKAAEEGS
jgi:hypothetical protein